MTINLDDELKKAHDHFLSKALKESAKAVKRMTPEQREKMHEEQRKSWVRGEMGMGTDKDEAEYAKAVLADDIETIKRLDAEADERARKVK